VREPFVALPKSIAHRVRSYRTGTAIIRLPQQAPAAVFLIALPPSQKIADKSGEMAERFKAAVLTRRQDAEADSGNAAGPEGAKGRMPVAKLP
jgi:hypothetical protein